MMLGLHARELTMGVRIFTAILAAKLATSDDVVYFDVLLGYGERAKGPDMSLEGYIIQSLPL